VSKLGVGEVEVLVLSKKLIVVGARVTRTGQKLAVEVGEWILGKTVDVMGRQIQGSDTVRTDNVLKSVDVTPRGIVGRRKITRQLVTGVIMVDMMIPVGHGQRELVMGDRKTGKSYLLWQVILSQAKLGSVCIYAAVGKKRTEIAKAADFFLEHKVADNTVVVATSSEDSAGEIYLCPYTAMSIAEYFRDLGRDVLLVLDDMSTHAKFYRELSLLSRKFPGRDSYPGDIFHVHSKLLERGGNFEVKKTDGQMGEAAITCLPVVETVQGDVTGYIQTNLMSMTDGHVYFDSDLFFKGRRPAINPFISVTRVGHQTQSKLGRDIGRILFDLLNNYEKTQGFLRFGAELGENSRQILAMGDKVLQFFDQPAYSVVPLSVGGVMLALLLSGIWDGKGLEKVLAAYGSDEAFKKQIDSFYGSCEKMSGLIEEVRKNAPSIMNKLT
jgi:F-type H+-transporting ATPase subunit alpha